MEDDETLHEESRREFQRSKNRSPMSPDHRVPLSQLDVAFSKVRSPSLRSPRKQFDYPNLDESKELVIRDEQFLAKSTPMDDDNSNNDSPLKMRNLEYNAETIKKKNALDQILSKAKKEYHRDNNRQIAVGGIDYGDFPGARVKKDLSKGKMQDPMRSRQMPL